MGKLRQLFSIALAAAILTTCALAQSNLTQIRDTIYNADGTPFNGTVVLTWVGFSTGTSSTVSPLSTSARIYNGALSVLLVPSTTASAGSYYQVVYYSNNGTTSWSETWSVPVSSTALTVSAVRTSSTTGTGSSSSSGSSGSSGSNGQYATLPIAITSVTGLSTDLNTINNSIGSLTTTVSGLNTTVSALSGLSNTVASNSNALAALNTTVAGLSTTVSSQASSISGLSSTVSSLNTSLTTLSNTVSALQSGAGTVSMAFVDGETPRGAINGSNATFTLSQTPAPVTSLQLYRNGLVQTNGVDFTISGSSITFLPVAIPITGDILQAYYRVTGSSPAPAFADDEVPAGTINGSNAAFTLQYTPNPASSLMLYKNGVLMQQNADYTIGGNGITFAAASTPQTGDSLTAYYRH